MSLDITVFINTYKIMTWPSYVLDGYKNNTDKGNIHHISISIA